MGLSVSILNSASHEILTQKFIASLTSRSSGLYSRTRSSKDSESFNKTQPAATVNLNMSDKMSCMNPNSSGDQKCNDMVLEKPPSMKGQVQDCDTDGLCRSASNVLPNLWLAESMTLPSPQLVSKHNAAAIKLQKEYESHQTQRNLAGYHSVVEEIWWKAMDFAALKNSSVSFFNNHKQETAVSKWVRAKTRVAKVGKGLSEHERAQKLAIKYWLEAIDPHHRYGRNLHLYYDVWLKDGSQPFFYWLDMGDGKEVNLDKCPRAKLQHQCVKYLGMREREAYEVIVKEGKLMFKQSGELLETQGDFKWIFVLSTSGTLYVGRKRLGCFQHSSFLAGAATTFAGRLVARGGVVEALWPYSGHYLPTDDNLEEFISFLEDNNVDTSKVKKYAYNDQGPYQVAEDDEWPPEKTANVPTQKQRKLEELIFCLAKLMHSKWTSSKEPRIGSTMDNPLDLQTRTLKQVNQSSRCAHGPFINHDPFPSPRLRSKVYGSPRLACMSLPSPRTQLASA